MAQQSNYKLPILPILKPSIFYVVVLVLFGSLGGLLENSSVFAQNAGTSSAAKLVSGKTADSSPKFAEIQQIIQDYFKRNPHYQEGDLIVREEAEKAMKTLQAEGYPVPDPDIILDKVLTQQSFLAKVLRNGRQGQEFMHQISKYSLSYDQLDRLGTQPVGRRTVIDLVRGPGGYKMLEYIDKSRYGKNMARMLSSDQAGGDYNKPTGRIYTAKQLTEAIWGQINPTTNGK